MIGTNIERRSLHQQLDRRERIAEFVGHARRELAHSCQAFVANCLGSSTFQLNDDLLEPFDGRIKLFVMRIALLLRRQNLKLFAAGDYVPLELRGERSEHLCAFARLLGEQFVLVIAPCLTARLRSDPGLPPMGEDAWRDTCLVLPEMPHCDSLQNALTGESHPIAPGSKVLKIRDLLKTFPLGLFSNCHVTVCGIDELYDVDSVVKSN